MVDRTEVLHIPSPSKTIALAFTADDILLFVAMENDEIMS
jgi:hypothetical protein